MKQGIKHLRESQGDHDEVNAGGADDEKSDDEGGQRGGSHGRGQGKPQIGRFVPGRYHR